MQLTDCATGQASCEAGFIAFVRGVESAVHVKSPVERDMQSGVKSYVLLTSLWSRGGGAAGRVRSARCCRLLLVPLYYQRAVGRGGFVPLPLRARCEETDGTSETCLEVGGN